MDKIKKCNHGYFFFFFFFFNIFILCLKVTTHLCPLNLNIKRFLQIKIINTQPKLALLTPRDLTGIFYLNQQSFLNQTGDVCM